LTLQHLVNNKVFGEITEAEIHYDVDFPFWMSSWKSPDWSPGQGMMFGLGSHTIDQALTLFGTPKSVTGFYRSLRGIESKTDDTFTIILQYSSNLVVTIKTSVVATMQYPLKYFVRGYDGTFVKYGEDVQESQVSTGRAADSEGFGTEPEDTFGLLTTKKQFHQAQKEVGGKWIGTFPSLKGDYVGFYKDLVKAIRGGEVAIKPEQSRDGIRIIELARQSADEGKTLVF
jgi:predicted dehydrogenase